MRMPAGFDLRNLVISLAVVATLSLLGVLVVGTSSSCKDAVKIVRKAGGFVDVHIRVPLPFLFSGSKSKPSKLVYLNREGALLKGGSDEASRNRASLAGSKPEDRIDVPAFRGSYLRWNSIVACVKKAYAPFGVEVVDRRPVEREYIMAMFGGKPKTVLKAKGKAHHKAAGLAPYNGLPIPNAVVLIFTRTIKESARHSCETAVHEIAHVYGLDHGYHCRDFMTYLNYCGKKRFVDKAVPCGERSKRKCKGGKTTQNSYRELAKVVGFKDGKAHAGRFSGLGPNNWLALR